MKRTVHPEDMEEIVKAYAQVFDSLNHHVHPNNQYPHPDELLSLIRSSPAMYGKEALQSDVPLSDGAKMLVDRLDESDNNLWVLCWGGTNVLAQALQYTRRERSSEDRVCLRSKLRVYAISDQDDTGMWIRHNFPDVFYISSTPAWNQYGLATWTGISGDNYYGFDRGGPDFTKLSKEWFREHIQIGPFGQAYPDYLFIPEGDSPTFMYLIQNGLGSPEHPEWRSWGGRYALVDPGQCGKHYADIVDRVVGKDGRTYPSKHATIWRWHDDYQNDFAARMKWSLTNNIGECNHGPVAIVNESTDGPEPFHMEAEVDTEIVFDASRSYDPDGDGLTYSWFQYKNVTATQWWVDAEVATIDIINIDNEKSGRKVKIQLPPAEKCAIDMFSGQSKELGQAFHFILELRDDETPSLTTYNRVIVQITNKHLKGGRGGAVESIAQVHATS